MTLEMDGHKDQPVKVDGQIETKMDGRKGLNGPSSTINQTIWETDWEF